MVWQFDPGSVLVGTFALKTLCSLQTRLCVRPTYNLCIVLNCIKKDVDITFSDAVLMKSIIVPKSEVWGSRDCMERSLSVWHKDLDTLWWTNSFQMIGHIWCVWVYQMWYYSCHRSLGVRFSKCNFFLWKPKNIASLLISLGVLSLSLICSLDSCTHAQLILYCASHVFTPQFLYWFQYCNVRGICSVCDFPWKQL